MTTVYFIRHAQPDSSVLDDRSRPLTEKGLADRSLVTEFLETKNIDAVLSSPYKRSVDTIADFADKNGFDIETIEDFRERENPDGWIGDWRSFIRQAWSDSSYKLPGGESNDDVQKRNIDALNDVLNRYKDKNIVIGTHGLALSMIINYYDRSYGFDDFMAMVDIMPWVAVMSFDAGNCAGIEKIDLFKT